MSNLNFSDAPESVREFLNYKFVNQGRSEKTCFQYYHDLRTFFRYLLISRYPKKYGEYYPGDLSFNEVNDKMVYSVKAEEINNFIKYCMKERDNSEAARNRKLSTLRSFYKYLSKTVRKMDNNPTEYIESPKRPKRLPKFLTLEESKLLLENIEQGKNYERDFAIITLFLNLGLRVSELVGINLKDISREFETLRVIGKGNKERMVYLNDACANAIKAYLEVREKNPRPEAKGALFISRNRNRLSDKSVQWLVYKHLKAAGLDRPGMSVHKLRHTAATLMYQYGHTDVRILKDILGHEDLSTTEIYTHVSDEQMKMAAMNNPLSEIKGVKRVNLTPLANNTKEAPDEED